MGVSIGRLRGLYGIVGPPAGAGGAQAREAMVSLTEALLAAGAPVIQLRDKRAGGAELLETARALRKLTRAAGALFVVNDRLDVALLADADGVHVGQEDLPVADVRAAAAAVGRGAGFLVGLSTHDPAELRGGLAAGADYLGYGPVFPTSTKEGALEARGLGRLREAVALAGGVPVVAIGGVALANAAGVAEAGAAMGAVISDVAAAADPRARAAALHRALGGAPGRD